jgi:hypothetical protein
MSIDYYEEPLQHPEPGHYQRVLRGLSIQKNFGGSNFVKYLTTVEAIRRMALNPFADFERRHLHYKGWLRVDFFCLLADLNVPIEPPGGLEAPKITQFSRR